MTSTPCNFGIFKVNNSEPYSISNKKPGRYIHIEDGGFGGVTGVQVLTDNNTNSCIFIYPNPVDQFVNIEICSSAQMPIKLKIINHLGVILKEQLLDEPNNIIDISNFKAGLYLMLIENNGKIETKKIIKQ